MMKTTDNVSISHPDIGPTNLSEYTGHVVLWSHLHELGIVLHAFNQNFPAKILFSIHWSLPVHHKEV